jgi:hypothetical protein
MTDDHDILMERLRTIAAAVDGPPPSVAEAARAALSTRRLDEELAELVLDSAAGTPVAARDGDDDIRLLSFETATVSIEVQLTEVAGSVSLRGLVSGATGEVVVETAGERRSAPIDADGWFTVDRLPSGLVRLRLRATDGTAVTTSWVFL